VILAGAVSTAVVAATDYAEDVSDGTHPFDGKEFTEHVTSVD
jgi:hypothetical protein